MPPVTCDTGREETEAVPVKGTMPNSGLPRSQALLGRSPHACAGTGVIACEALVSIPDRWPERSGLGGQAVSGRPWA